MRWSVGCLVYLLRGSSTRSCSWRERETDRKCLIWLTVFFSLLAFWKGKLKVRVLRTAIFCIQNGWIFWWCDECCCNCRRLRTHRWVENSSYDWWMAINQSNQNGVATCYKNALLHHFHERSSSVGIIDIGRMRCDGGRKNKAEAWNAPSPWHQMSPGRMRANESEEFAFTSSASHDFIPHDKRVFRIFLSSVFQRTIADLHGIDSFIADPWNSIIPLHSPTLSKSVHDKIFISYDRVVITICQTTKKWQHS